MRRLILAALVLTLTAPVTTDTRPANSPPARAECFAATAEVLLEQLPTERTSTGCLPRGTLVGKVATAAPVTSSFMCPTDECGIYIWGEHGIGYQDLWTYPVQTVNFYGYRCYQILNHPPQGKPGSDAFGLFDSYGQGAMTHRPAIWLQWCSQNGLVRSGATVACTGTPVYPYYFNNSSCSWSITPGFKPTRTVGAGWTFTGVAGKETVGLMATIVAGPASGGRDVLIQGWRWSL